MSDSETVSELRERVAVLESKARRQTVLLLIFVAASIIAVVYSFGAPNRRTMPAPGRSLKVDQIETRDLFLVDSADRLRGRLGIFSNGSAALMLVNDRGYLAFSAADGTVQPAPENADIAGPSLSLWRDGKNTLTLRSTRVATDMTISVADAQLLAGVTATGDPGLVMRNQAGYGVNVGSGLFSDSGVTRSRKSAPSISLSDSDERLVWSAP